jgi:drug/metabolite transporter (DMT)-like permease
MSEPLYADPAAPLQPEPQHPVNAGRGLNFAEWMLVLATLVWGCSFALAKDAGEIINRAAGVSQHALGPMLVLSLRFTVASVAWFVLIAPAREGWKRQSVIDGVVLGVFLAAGMVLQHIALDYTIEAVAAFLTSLTVIFVPMILWAFWRQALPAAAWVGVVVAVPGVWLMSGASSLSLGFGEWMGLACAFVFAWHIPMLNRYAARDTPWRMCGAQFVIVALACWLCTGVALSHVDTFDWSVLGDGSLWTNILLLVAGPTLVSFGLANVYQPRVHAIRAVLIYLLEPIFAAIFAWMWTGRSMTAGMMMGGALILAANAVVELWPQKQKAKGG